MRMDPDVDDSSCVCLVLLIQDNADWCRPRKKVPGRAWPVLLTEPVKNYHG